MTPKTDPTAEARPPAPAKPIRTPLPLSDAEVRNRIVDIRGQAVIVDADVAALYGVATKRINEAVRNNRDKFPDGYMFELDSDESRSLRSKFSSLESGGRGAHSKYNYKAFTEKGLYMLATILKSRRATEATFAIIETFAKVRALKRELVELHREEDPKTKPERARRFGEMLADIVMPGADAVETESSLELNFLIGKIKHTVRKVRKSPAPPGA